MYDALPYEIQRRADNAYALWQLNPQARGLNFKRVNTNHPYYSVRIGRGYRAIDIAEEDEILWFWIGAHDEYERILRGL
ncbi:MAG: hypothetical protein WAU10_27260 [Caldilineaceae bacterium]